MEMTFPISRAGASMDEHGGGLARLLILCEEKEAQRIGAGNVEHLLQERDHAVVRRDRVVQLDARPLASAQRKV